MKRVGVAVGSAELDTLFDMLSALRTQHANPRCVLIVALLPPLVRARHIELPPLRDGDLRSILARDSEQYWPGIHAAQTIAARRSRPNGYLIAAADAALVSSVLDTARQAGWPRVSLVPAYAAWEQAGRAVMRDGFLLLERPGVMEALQLRRGHLTLVRRFRASTQIDQVQTALGDHVVVPLSEPEIAAATYAPQARGLELVPDGLRTERARYRRRWAARLFGGAVALTVLAAGLELWGRRRELMALRAERAALARQVARAVTLREAVDGLDRRLVVLHRAESAPPRWSTIIATVAEHLPSDAYLVNLRGNGDSLVLDGVASRAATAFEALQRAPGISGVRADAPIRQEARDSQPPIERFTLGARLGMPRLALR